MGEQKGQSLFPVYRHYSRKMATLFRELPRPLALWAIPCQLGLERLINEVINRYFACRFSWSICCR